MAATPRPSALRGATPATRRAGSHVASDAVIGSTTGIPTNVMGLATFGVLFAAFRRHLGSPDRGLWALAAVVPLLVVTVINGAIAAVISGSAFASAKSASVSPGVDEPQLPAN